MLANFVSVYVPGTNGASVRLSRERQREIADETARALSLRFGGATAIPSTGYFVGENGALVKERVIIVKSYHDKPIAEALDIARDLAAGLKARLNQEAVTVETESGIEFI